MLRFLIGAHIEAKWFLKILGFCLKPDTGLPLIIIGGMIGIFLLLKNLFMIHQYLFETLL